MLKFMKALGFLPLVVLMTLAIAQAQAPTTTAQGQIDGRGLYAVLPGDTLYGIADRYGVGLRWLIERNDLSRRARPGDACILHSAWAVFRP